MNIRFFFSALVISLAAVAARADVQVGDKPKLSFKDFISHKNVDLADLKGKINP